MAAIRTYEPRDQDAVRALFVAVNRELAPPHQRAAFEAYIAHALHEEVERIPDYYAERDGCFWVVDENDALVGMFGYERIGSDVAELRRMYLAASARGRGLADQMLRHAEAWCYAGGYRTMMLSTSEVQRAALAFYRKRGYALVREEAAP